MDLREATAEDVDAVRSVARESLVASYGHAVDEALLDEAVEEWYDAGDLGDDVEDDDAVFPVAVVDGVVVGFAESYVVGRRERVGEIDWLHVHPDHRGSGIGSALLERVESALRSADVDRIEARVLADNEAGTEFYEREGYELAGEREVDIGGELFAEREFRKQVGRLRGISEATYQTEDGETVHVAFDESDRGSQAPFYVAYVDPDHERRYGYLCGNCEGTDIAIDTMDRMECRDCGNRRKPARWDAAY
ncbi:MULTISPECIES: GNAT family N-acetyltransferase [unclassified Halorubrum]|jgi:ribosomal protein S18 acetylase RimI-like enzyme|uniref:GNAT family N-acetyltransferase n=1 Tax=unclassified Halorubrum TaxID=2642239 RepID=UPI000EF177D9|nr:MULTISPECIES: GNAT family N-acetyltransferase [unclassified Halorubrum]RLM52117.1 GNAT family N-acetyltransferase [Halorubrum sp. Atlit-28R]TKX45854.1 GNAT family N-acetyltransferase [Halorubrum sp. ARQ200]